MRRSVSERRSPLAPVQIQVIPADCRLSPLKLYKNDVVHIEEPEPPAEDVNSVTEVQVGQEVNISAVDGASRISKEEDPCAFEMLEDHEALMSVLSARAMRLRAAHTLWKQGPPQLFSYLRQIADDTVTNDLLPFIASQIGKNGSLPLESYFDLLPQLEKLLTAKYEDHIRSVVEFVTQLVQHYWKEIEDFQNTNTFKVFLVSISDTINRLKGTNGPLSAQAKALDVYLTQV